MHNENFWPASLSQFRAIELYPGQRPHLVQQPVSCSGSLVASGNHASRKNEKPHHHYRWGLLLSAPLCMGKMGKIVLHLIGLLVVSELPQTLPEWFLQSSPFRAQAMAAPMYFRDSLKSAACLPARIRWEHFCCSPDWHLLKGFFFFQLHQEYKS